jgi:hypothetical protein
MRIYTLKTKTRDNSDIKGSIYITECYDDMLTVKYKLEKIPLVT